MFGWLVWCGNSYTLIPLGFRISLRRRLFTVLWRIQSIPFQRALKKFWVRRAVRLFVSQGRRSFALSVQAEVEHTFSVSDRPVIITLLTLHGPITAIFPPPTFDTQTLVMPRKSQTWRNSPHLSPRESCCILAYLARYGQPVRFVSRVVIAKVDEFLFRKKGRLVGGWGPAVLFPRTH